MPRVARRNSYDWPLRAGVRCLEQESALPKEGQAAPCPQWTKEIRFTFLAFFYLPVGRSSYFACGRLSDTYSPDLFGCVAHFLLIR